MRAILLAAGFGARLRPLTNKTPKCLVPIHGKPLLDIWLEQLTSAGISSFLVNTHHLSEQVEAYVRLSPYMDRVTLTYERELLGTAGALIANLDFYAGQDGLLLHADNYSLPDITEFLCTHRHRPPSCLMTMMTFQTDSPSSCGVVELNEKGVVIGFHEKVDSPPGNLANGAVYALSAELMRMLKADYGDAKDFSTEVLPQLVGKIFAYRTPGFFLDIGTPESYEKANRMNGDAHILVQ